MAKMMSFENLSGALDDAHPLCQLLRELAGVLINEEETTIGQALACLVSENPLDPLTGAELWAKIGQHYGKGNGDVDFLKLAGEVSDRIILVRTISPGRGTSLQRAGALSQSPADNGRKTLGKHPGSLGR